MTSKTKLILSAATLAILSFTPVLAKTVVTQSSSVSSVTSKSSTVGPDGSVTYESHTIETKGAAPAVIVDSTMPPMTFYYYSPKIHRIVSADNLTNDVISIWDTNHNNVIDNHEYYTNQMVAYEPIEYSKRTYQDINGDGIPDLTQEEYTTRLEQVSTYGTLNTDKKEGLTLYEFTGVGFQEADINNDGQIDFDELRKAFYHHIGLTPKPLKLND